LKETADAWREGVPFHQHAQEARIVRNEGKCGAGEGRNHLEPPWGYAEPAWNLKPKKGSSGKVTRENKQAPENTGWKGNGLNPFFTITHVKEPKSEGGSVA